MSIYETIKAAVTIRQAAERYGLRVNHTGMACCPFHEDKHPSLKLNEDYYYCFGCGAHGDVIDFMARLFGLNPYAAAQKLAADFGIDMNCPTSPPTAQYPTAIKFKTEETLCRSVLAERFRLLHEWKIRYTPQSPDEPFDDRFIEALKYLDYTEYLLDAFDFGSPSERVEIIKNIKEKEVLCA